MKMTETYFLIFSRDHTEPKTILFFPEFRVCWGLVLWHTMSAPCGTMCTRLSRLWLSQNIQTELGLIRQRVDSGILFIERISLERMLHVIFIILFQYHIRGKKILKFSLVPRASKVKCLLVLLPNNLSEIYCQINFFWIFYLPARHWMKIFACPAWNFTCLRLQDKWFFYPCTYLFHLWFVAGYLSFEF